MMDEKHKGEIALKVLEQFFQPGFSFDYKRLSMDTGVSEYELREIIEPFVQKLEAEIMWKDFFGRKIWINEQSE